MKECEALKKLLLDNGYEKLSEDTFKLDSTRVRVYNNEHVKVNGILYAGLDVCERVKEKLGIK